MGMVRMDPPTRDPDRDVMHRVMAAFACGFYWWGVLSGYFAAHYRTDSFSIEANRNPDSWIHGLLFALSSYLVTDLLRWIRRRLRKN